MTVSRRRLLTQTAALGCSLAASPLLTPVTLAATPGERRLVVILLRGGLDGLDAVQPYGDPGWHGLRSRLSGGPDAGAQDLDGFFALHPGLAQLMPLWRAGELGFMHAVSTPYRDKRSHFDGQDMLEAGTPSLVAGRRDGWLNRMLQRLPGTRADHAYAIGRGDMRLLTGAAPVANWTPEADLSLSPQARELMGLIMAEDPAFNSALMEADRLSALSSDGPLAAKGHIAIASFAAERLKQEARIAAFSLNGWDTHRSQHRTLPRALERLSDTVLTLKDQLGEAVWSATTVLALTEFGRTARENGTGGTDHGTGGLALFAGGGIRGGRVYGDWPGLTQEALYQGRDLMPTQDVRALAGWVIKATTGLSNTDIENVVFPGLRLPPDPGLFG